MTEQDRPARQVVVVDIEANGLDHKIHEAVEVAWWNLDTGKRGVFIPRHNVSRVLKRASIKALQINRYVDRIADQPQDTDGEQAMRLWEELSGRTAEWRSQQSSAFVLALEAVAARNRGEPEPPPPPGPVAATLLGSNPRFDARMLEKVFRRINRKPEPCHYRLRDISAYAMGVLGLDYQPGLAELCERLGVEPGDHSAEADVTATGVAYLKLRSMRPEVAEPWDAKGNWQGVG
jgi:DNA polymerase III epsilon subunit-like protein